MKSANIPKLRKGQKCEGCKKVMANCSFIYNGFYWHEKCYNKHSEKRLKDYLKNL